MRWEMHIPGKVRFVLIGLCILGFAAGSLEPNATGGIVALISALLIIFLFFFTEPSSRKVEARNSDAAENGTH